MIDSRFLNLDTRIDGIIEGDSSYNKVTTSRVANGKRYLVLGTDTAYQYHNCIVYNDNGTLVSIPSRKGMPPVIDNMGNILSYDGTSWTGIGHVGAILVEDIIDFICVDTDSSTVQNKFSNKAGVKFLQTDDAYDGDAAILISTGDGTTCIVPSYTVFDEYAHNNGFFYLANNEDGKVYYTIPFSTSNTDGAVPIPIEIGAETVIIHKSTGRTYTYDEMAHKWTPVSGVSIRYVDDVIACDYTSSEYDKDISEAGAKFICTNGYGGYMTKNVYTANGTGGGTVSVALSGSSGLNPDEYWLADMYGNLYFYTQSDMLSEDSAWVDYGQLHDNELIISKADYSMYRVATHGGGLIKLGGNASSSGSSSGSSSTTTVAGIINEVFTLTATNISSKSVTLSSSVASGKTNSVLVFLGGAVHTAGTDFSVSGNILSWSGLALDTAGIKQDDKFIVQYVPAE